MALAAYSARCGRVRGVRVELRRTGRGRPPLPARRRRPAAGPRRRHGVDRHRPVAAPRAPGVAAAALAVPGLADRLAAGLAPRVDDLSRGFVRAVRRRDWLQAAGVGRWLARLPDVPETLGLDTGLVFVGRLGAADPRVDLHVAAAQRVLRAGPVTAGAPEDSDAADLVDRVADGALAWLDARRDRFRLPADIAEPGVDVDRTLKPLGNWRSWRG
ncbi:hypothetical protein ACU686_43955 [Yinghuangia aomiensis]